MILLARDGDVPADVRVQACRLREAVPGATVVIICGSNDMPSPVGHMHTGVRSVLEAAELLASWQAGFRAEYRRVLDNVLVAGRWSLVAGLPVAVSAICDGVPGLSPGLRATLAMFNDVILHEPVVRKLPVLDPRLVCDEPENYSTVSPIEPSRQGGGKIAAALAELVPGQDTAAVRTVVFGPGRA